MSEESERRVLPSDLGSERMIVVYNQVRNSVLVGKIWLMIVYIPIASNDTLRLYASHFGGNKVSSSKYSQNANRCAAL